MLKDKLNISTIDIDLYKNHIYNKDKIKSLDVNSRFKRFRFFYNGLLLNLENITVRAYMIKSDGKEIFNDLTIIDGNIAELEFTNQSLLVPGILKLELVLYEDDAELSSFLLEYEVIKSLRSDNSIESSNEYNSLQIALQKVELWNKNYQALYDKWNNDFNILYANKSAILDNLKTTKENELNKLKIDKNNELETLHNTKESELNKLKSDKDNELTTLYNSKDEELNTLKNTWDEEFKKKYDGLNKEYSDRVVTLEDDILNSNSSESLLNENVTSFKVGTGTINGVAKDYTNDMEQSLVTLDNIDGRSDIVTSNDGIKKFKNLSMKNIFTLNEKNTLNYFESATMGSGNATGIKNGTNIHVTISNSSWGSRLWTVTGLTPGKVYCISTEVLLNDGGSALDISGAEKIDKSFIKHSDHMDSSSQNNILVLALSESLNIHFYCTLTKEENGDVHYNNVNIREVKDYSYVDLELKAIRNDIKDKFSNGLIIQKISSITVNGTLGYSSDLGSFSNVYRCFVNVEQFLSPSDIVNTYFFESTYLPYSYDYNLDSEHYYLSENAKQVCLFIAKDKVDNLFGDTISDKIITYLKNNPLYINYVHSGIIKKSINASILLNKNDVLYTDSNRDINCTHKIQLNTKSQVEELQKSFVSEKKSVWSKFIEYTKFNMLIAPKGYLQLPKIVGGFMIQWGFFEVNCVNGFTGASSTQSFHDTNRAFPVKFPNTVYHSSCGITGIKKGASRSLMYHEIFEVKCCPYEKNLTGEIGFSVWRRENQRDLTDRYVIIDWIAFGR